MRGHSGWSYAPYRPFMTEVGDPYICRIAPGADSIHFEWLNAGEECAVFYRKRGEGEFVCLGTTCENFFDISGLETDTDHEFYVQAGRQSRSRIRLARTAQTIGTVVNYLHPDDEAYAFSGRYLCSPSFVRHPDGYLLASMDLFAGNHPQNLTLIFRSDDEGKTWHYVSELVPCFWGKMFIHNGELYMLSCATEYGDLLIGKSTDGGKTFCTPVCLLRGSNGKNGSAGIHKNPQNILFHKGRIYTTLDWGSYRTAEYCHAAMVMSCSVEDNLLNPESWSFTEPKVFETYSPELACLPKGTVPIEGTLAVSPDGEIFNIMRLASYYLPMSITDGENNSDHNLADLSKLILKGCAIVYRMDNEAPCAPLSFSHTVPIATSAKFTVKYDSVSGKYYALVSRITDKTKLRARNVLTLFTSEDLREFTPVKDVIDFSDADSNTTGFQYVDFEIEENDIIFLSRTAMNNANNYHDANYSTFHRIENFRKLTMN